MIDFAFVESSVDIFYEWFRLVRRIELRKVVWRRFGARNAGFKPRLLALLEFNSSEMNDLHKSEGISGSDFFMQVISSFLAHFLH
jgi:hypothetical protein